MYVCIYVYGGLEGHCRYKPSHALGSPSKYSNLFGSGGRHISARRELE